MRSATNHHKHENHHYNGRKSTRADMPASSCPSPLSGATTTDSPDSLLFFFGLLYEKAKSAAKDSASEETKNPLIGPRELAMIESSGTYIGAVIATVWGLPIQQFWQKQGL